MKKFLFILCLVFLLNGCDEKIIESSISEIIPENQTESSAVVTEETIVDVPTESTTEEISLPENAISIEKASDLLLNKLHNYGYNTESNQHLAYDSTKIFNYRPCYVFFSYDDFEDNRATTGWYSVNPVTGECFDIITEPIPLLYRFKITKCGIEVYEKYDDEPLQILSIDPDFTPNPDWLYEMNEKYNDPYHLIHVNDFDFDGYDDISVQVYLGATNATFQYYRYNPETQQFENWNELNSLYYGVQIDMENKTLSVHSKSSAVDADDTVYKWFGDVLVPVSAEKRYWNGADIFKDYIEYDENGNEMVVKREKQIYDDDGSLISATDITP